MKALAICLMPISTFKVSSAVHRAKRKRPSQPILIRARYKSRLEDRIAQQLEEEGVGFTYEANKHPYVIPARKAKYVEDFDLGPFLIEAKGYFTPDDRKKLLLLKEQSPELDIRLLFQRATNKLHKASPTTYAKWCDDHGFQWADGGKVPREWIAEAKQQRKSPPTV